MSKDSNATIFSIIGGARRSGRWLVPEKTKVTTLFGRAVIDLRQARTSAEELEFTCLSLFANITFLVPEGAEVRPSGMAILGSSKCMVPESSQQSVLPAMSVDATTIFGRLRIRTTDEERDERGDDERDEQAEVPTAAVATMPVETPSVVSPIHNVDVPDSLEHVELAEMAETAPIAEAEAEPETTVEVELETAEATAEDLEPAATDA